MKTPKGTELQLIQLKGKDYLQVAQRLIWFNEIEKNFAINTDFLLLTAEETVCRAVVTVIGEGGVRRSSTATKRESLRDFGDHTEKAETGAIGRALALLGYGTQFATADLDEGDRIVDSPVALRAPSPVKVVSMPNGGSISVTGSEVQAALEIPTPARTSAFKRITKVATPPTDELDVS